MILKQSTAAQRVRDVLPSLPPEFTVKDVKAKLPLVSTPAIYAALNWAKKHGMVRVVKKYTAREWRDLGNNGAPPILYNFVGGVDVAALPSRRSTAPRQQKAQEIAIPNTASLPEAIAAFVESSPHQCDATDVLANVQRSLTTLNLLIALQQMTPEQAMQLVGTIGAIGRASR
jgi:hypothetical protein